MCLLEVFSDAEGSSPPPPDLGTGCAWTTGDGVGGTEESLGAAPTPQACVQLVQQTRPEANGATYRQGGTACYAEFGMTDTNGSASWITCFFLVVEDICTYAPGDARRGV